jgi:hypothetical protein
VGRGWAAEVEMEVVEAGRGRQIELRCMNHCLRLVHTPPQGCHRHCQTLSVSARQKLAAAVRLDGNRVLGLVAAVGVAACSVA